MISETVILQMAQAIERDADHRAARASYHRALGFDAGRIVGRREAVKGVEAAQYGADRWREGYNAGHAAGLSEGVHEDDARQAGYDCGYDCGYEEGLDSAQHAAYEQGRADAHLSYDDGVTDGRYAAEQEHSGSLGLAMQEEYQRGLTQGRQENYQQGYDAGRHIGFRLCKSRVAEDIVNFISEVSEG